MTLEALPLDESFSIPSDTARLERASAALRENGYIVHVVDTVAEARDLVGTLLPTDQTIFTAASETLRIAGITADVDESGKYQSIRASAPTDDSDLYARVRLGANPDVVLGSVHAITEEGTLVVGSATGSQFAPYASGARRVIWVVGSQKIVTDLDAALRRIRTYSLPSENQRLQDLYGQSSFLGKFLVVEREAFPERATVVLVRETIGY